MFTIKSSQAPSKKSVQKHFMKIVSVKFSKDEFCSKKEVTRFYKDNYKILGIPLEINNKDYWNENDDFYYIQACDLFK